MSIQMRTFIRYIREMTNNRANPLELFSMLDSFVIKMKAEAIDPAAG